MTYDLKMNKKTSEFGRTSFTRFEVLLLAVIGEIYTHKVLGNVFCLIIISVIKFRNDHVQQIKKRPSLFNKYWISDGLLPIAF